MALKWYNVNDSLCVLPMFGVGEELFFPSKPEIQRTGGILSGENRRWIHWVAITTNPHDIE